MGVSVDIKGLKELQGKFQILAADNAYLKDDILEKCGKDLKKLCKDKTKLGRGKKHLRNRYKLSKVKREGDEDWIELTNTSPHFHLVERGHRLIIKGKEIGFVPGQRMVERSVEEYDEIFLKEIDNWLSEKLQE